MRRGPSGSGLTLLYSWSQLIIMPRALVCAALQLLLSAHCPACCPYSSLAFHVSGCIRETQASFSFSPVQVLLHSRVSVTRNSAACAGGLVNPKGGGFSAHQEPFGSKHLSVLRKKQAGPTSGCFLCINFSPLWHLVAYFLKMNDGESG